MTTNSNSSKSSSSNSKTSSSKSSLSYNIGGPIWGGFYKGPTTSGWTEAKSKGLTKTTPTHVYYGGGGGATNLAGPSKAEIERQKKIEEQKKIQQQKQAEQIRQKKIIQQDKKLIMGIGNNKYINKNLKTLQENKKKITQPYEKGLEYLTKAQEYHNLLAKTKRGKQKKLEEIAMATSIGLLKNVASFPKAIPEMITSTTGGVYKIGYEIGRNPKQGVKYAGKTISETSKGIYNYYMNNPTQLLADALTLKVFDSIGKEGRINPKEAKIIKKINPKDVHPKLKIPLEKLKKVVKNEKTTKPIEIKNPLKTTRLEYELKYGKYKNLPKVDKDVIRGIEKDKQWLKKYLGKIEEEKVKSKWLEAQEQKKLNKLIKKEELAKQKKLKYIKKQAEKEGLKDKVIVFEKGKYKFKKINKLTEPEIEEIYKKTKKTKELKKVSIKKTKEEVQKPKIEKEEFKGKQIQTKEGQVQIQKELTKDEIKKLQKENPLEAKKLQKAVKEVEELQKVTKIVEKVLKPSFLVTTPVIALTELSNASKTTPKTIQEKQLIPLTKQKEKTTSLTKQEEDVEKVPLQQQPQTYQTIEYLLGMTAMGTLLPKRKNLGSGPSGGGGSFKFKPYSYARRAHPKYKPSYGGLEFGIKVSSKPVLVTGAGIRGVLSKSVGKKKVVKKKKSKVKKVTKKKKVKKAKVVTKNKKVYKRKTLKKKQKTKKSKKRKVKK